jgi:ParB family chromosome partitioning protein
MVKNGLGRGLDSLFGSEGPEKKEDVLLIPVSQIRPNPFQPRKTFREEEIREMAESLKNHGLLQPVIVMKKERPDGQDGEDEYILIAGERRFRAARSLEWATIPAVIRTYGDRELLELALVENLQRSDLNPVEVAEGFNRLIEEFSWTQEELAAHLGMKRSTIANFLRILTLPPGILQKIEQGELSFGHAKVLLGVKDSREQLILEEEIVRNNMSVRDLENRISEKQVRQDVPLWGKKGADLLSKAFSHPVHVSRSKNKVKFTVAIENESELTAFLERMGFAQSMDLIS